MKLAGSYAMDSLRIEKGYRHMGHDLDSETTPIEARLMHSVDMKKVCASYYPFTYCIALMYFQWIHIDGPLYSHT